MTTRQFSINTAMDDDFDDVILTVADMDDGFGYHYDGNDYYANGAVRQAPRPATWKQINEWRAQQ